jgi:hypothetical protein
MEKCCGTCNWWEKNNGWEYGTCKDALKRARKLVPESVWIPYEMSHDCDQRSVKVTQMAPFGGVDCPCYQPKMDVTNEKETRN